jgi:hypothetical protein
MLSLRALLLVTLSLTASVLAQEKPHPTDLQIDSRKQFHELLNALPEESLHAALHMHHPNFRDGVYEKDKSAVEAVHSSNPPLATRLLAVAALELIKRQNGSVPATSTTPPATSSQTTVVVPVVVSTTNSAGSTIVSTTSAIASASVSVAVPVTTTNSQGSTVVTSSTVAGAIVVSNGVTTTSPVPVFTPQPTPTGTQAVDLTTTDNSGNTVILSSVTSGQVISATDARGSTFLTTYTPGGGQVSSLFLLTTTLPNGQQSTITSFAVVKPSGTGSSGGSGTGPHLQNAAATPVARNREAVALVGAAIGVAMLI